MYHQLTKDKTNHRILLLCPTVNLIAPSGIITAVQNISSPSAPMNEGIILVKCVTVRQN